MKSFNHKKAFTLIELTVVIGIILLMTAITLPNYRAGESQFALQRSANKLAQDIRRAQEMAMSAREFEGVIPKGGYGIYLTTSTATSYILFADISDPANYQYDGETERVEDIGLEIGVGISSLSPSSPLTITFTPPDPVVRINTATSTITTTTTLTIDSATKTITVNRAGLIYVE